MFVDAARGPQPNEVIRPSFSRVNEVKQTIRGLSEKGKALIKAAREIANTPGRALDMLVKARSIDGLVTEKPIASNRRSEITPKEEKTIEEARLEKSPDKALKIIELSLPINDKKDLVKVQTDERQIFMTEVGGSNEFPTKVFAQSFRANKPADIIPPFKDGKPGRLVGCMDADGMIYWTEAKISQDDWMKILGKTPAAYLELSSLDRLFIESPDICTINAISDFAKRTNLSDKNTTINQLNNVINPEKALRRTIYTHLN